MQVYGRHSKLTHIPEALYKENLPNDKYQYELALVALQTEKIALDGEVKLAFYGYFTEDFPYGLKYIWQLAQENKIECPYINKVYEWGINKVK